MFYPVRRVRSYRVCCKIRAPGGKCNLLEDVQKYTEGAVRAQPAADPSAGGADRKAEQEDRRGDRVNTDVHTFDRSVNSLFFWAYANMLLALANCLISLQTWSEGCACHQAKDFWLTPDVGHRSYMSRRNRLRREFGNAFASSCPRAGRVPREIHTHCRD